MWESVHLERSQHFRMMTWGVCQMCCSFIIHWLSSLGYYRLKAKTLLKSTMTLMCILKIFPPVSFLTLKSIERSSLLNLVLLRISFHLIWVFHHLWLTQDISRHPTSTVVTGFVQLCRLEQSNQTPQSLMLHLFVPIFSFFPHPCATSDLDIHMHYISGYALFPSFFSQSGICMDPCWDGRVQTAA